jgi:transposase
LRKGASVLIGRQSTGELQRRLVRALQGAGYAVSVVNPERIWAYRRLVG